MSSKILDDMRDVMRRRHYSIRTERSYCEWVKRFVVHHPSEIRFAVLRNFTRLAPVKYVSLSVSRISRGWPQPSSLNFSWLLFPSKRNAQASARSM